MLPEPEPELEELEFAQLKNLPFPRFASDPHLVGPPSLLSAHNYPELWSNVSDHNISRRVYFLGRYRFESTLVEEHKQSSPKNTCEFINGWFMNTVNKN